MASSPEFANSQPLSPTDILCPKTAKGRVTLRNAKDRKKRNENSLLLLSCLPFFLNFPSLGPFRRYFATCEISTFSGRTTLRNRELFAKNLRKPTASSDE